VNLMFLRSWYGAGGCMRKVGVVPRPVHVRCVVEKVALGQGFLSVLLFCSVNLIPLTLQTNLHLQIAVTRRTGGLSLGTFQKPMLLRKSRSIGQKISCAQCFRVQTNIYISRISTKFIFVIYSPFWYFVWLKISKFRMHRQQQWPVSILN
jgi:hypothetical protein